MPQLAREQGAVTSGRLKPEDIYQNARYDAGYRMGWRDAHSSSRFRPGRRAMRQKYEQYSAGYEDGWEDGKGHPCPEWDDAHRIGSKRDLPEGCTWRIG